MRMSGGFSKPWITISDSRSDDYDTLLSTYSSMYDDTFMQLSQWTPHYHDLRPSSLECLAISNSNPFLLEIVA